MRVVQMRGADEARAEAYAAYAAGAPEERNEVMRSSSAARSRALAAPLPRGIPSKPISDLEEGRP